MVTTFGAIQSPGLRVKVRPKDLLREDAAIHRAEHHLGWADATTPWPPGSFTPLRTFIKLYLSSSEDSLDFI